MSSDGQTRLTFRSVLDATLRSPWGKLSLALGFIVAFLSLVQALTSALGLSFSVWEHSQGARSLLLGVTLGTLVLLMGLDRRPLRDYGLCVSDHWVREFTLGGLAGIGMFVAYGALMVAFGVARCAPNPHASVWLSSGFTGLAAIPVAIVQQVIISGYLYSLLRDRLSPWSSSMLVGLLFAFMNGLSVGTNMFHGHNLELFIGLTFAASFLALVRHATGNILLASGLLSGWIYAGRMIRKTSLFEVERWEPLRDWLYPQGDLRMALPIWGLLALSGLILACLPAGGTSATAGPQVVSHSFKRYFPLSGAHLLAPLDIWLRQLWRVRGQVGWLYLPRLLFSLALSCLNTLLCLPERCLLPLLLRKKRVPPPVFIVGVHRSGTTHLHNLMALDPQFVTPLAYQVLNPVGCLFSGWLITPVLGAFMPWKRPMDDVRFHLFTPQEEEFALANSSPYSPYWGLTFPRSGAEFDRYIFPDRLSAAERKSWRHCYHTFMQQVVFWTTKRPLLKNPHNTGRAGILKEMYPDAKFVHIYRHPEDVYRSNAHMEREGHCTSQLQDADPQTSYMARFLSVYRAMEDSYYHETKTCPATQVVDVKFEDLESDPRSVVRRVYTTLELPWTDEFEQRLNAYLATIADYQKNKLKTLPPDTEARVHAALQPYYARWNYRPRSHETADTATRKAA